MKIETIEKILNFLYEKEGKEIPEAWLDSREKLKLIKELENHPDGTQYRYDGDLVLSYSNITKLPNDLYVDGYFELIDCKQLTELPNKLYVGNNLVLLYSKISELPDNLYVGGLLSLVHINITEIPNNLYVGHSVYINKTPLTEKYSDKEIKDIVRSKGGTIIGIVTR